MQKKIEYLLLTIPALALIAVISYYLGASQGISKESLFTYSDTTSSSTENEPSVAVSTTNTLYQPTSTTKAPQEKSITSKINTSSYHSYTDASYHFAIKFPPYISTRNTFTTFHQLSNNWRVFSESSNQGKAILEIPLLVIDQGVYATGKQTYPLFFGAFVRIGISPNTQECYALDKGYASQTPTNVTISNVSWKKFVTEDAAMMKYVRVASYRTVHNNLCYVIQHIKNGSSYKDDTMTTAKTDKELEAVYLLGDTVVKSFVFTK